MDQRVVSFSLQLLFQEEGSYVSIIPSDTMAQSTNITSFPPFDKTQAIVMSNFLCLEEGIAGTQLQAMFCVKEGNASL